VTRVVKLLRNDWSICSGMTGQFGPESVGNLDRNQWSICSGIRNNKPLLGRSGFFLGVFPLQSFLTQGAGDWNVDGDGDATG
jgi:hypothetical protein